MVQASEVDLRSIRLLVVSPLATVAVSGPTFLGAHVGERQSATSPSEVAKLFTSPRRRYDVVLVDLMWNDFALEWRFDGLDVVDLMHRSGRHEPVLLACQGHGFERPYLEEGRDLPDVHGLVLKSRPDVLLHALQAAANGDSYSDDELVRVLHPTERGIHTYFDRSVRLARFAGAIAAGCPGSYTGLAAILHISQANANRAPELFRPMLRARGELPSQEAELSQASIFRWCGQHAYYIVSWCRRHAIRFGGMSDHPAWPLARSAEPEA